MAPKTQAYLVAQPLCEVASLTEVQALGIAAAEAAGRAVFSAWSAVLVAIAKELGLDCPCCGRRRKCKTRPKDPLRITVLGMEIEKKTPGTSCWKRRKSSARAEAQVRDRSKKRFNVAGAWKRDNLEPKATLRAIIHEGDWDNFKRSELASEQSNFAQALQARLQKAVTEGRLGPAVISDIESPRPASAQADRDLPQVHAR